VVRLLLFRSANIARYRLPDHLFPPVRTVFPRLRRSQSVPSSLPCVRQRTHPPTPSATDGRTLGIALLYFIARRGGGYETGWQVILMRAKSGWQAANRLETEHAARRYERRSPQMLRSPFRIFQITAVARSTPSWLAPGSAGRCNKGRSA
jgi:hypothetical protein